MKGGFVLEKRIVLRGKLFEVTIPICTKVSDCAITQEELENYESRFQKVTSVLERYHRYFEKPLEYNSDDNSYTYSFVNSDSALLALTHCVCELTYTEQHDWAD